MSFNSHINYSIIESVKSIGKSYTRVIGSHSHKNFKTVYEYSHKQNIYNNTITFVLKFILSIWKKHTHTVLKKLHTLGGHM